MSIRIANKFLSKEVIGHGSFGSIYSGVNIYNNELVAIKFETSINMKQKLFRESRIYQLISGAPGFPSLKHYGTEGDTAALIIDLLGKNILSLFELRHHNFSLKTVIMIATQLITRLEYLHAKSIIHRDIKPDNMAIGVGKQSNQVYLIDFGLAKSYRDMKTHIHNESKVVPYLVGTPLYASINAMKNYEQGRRDDIESLAYVLIYLMKGSLPWEKIKSVSIKEMQDLILQQKEAITPEVLCEGLPEEFLIFLTTAKNLRFDEEPEYGKYRQMFFHLLQRNNSFYDYNFDWGDSSKTFHDSYDAQVNVLIKQTKSNELLKQKSPFGEQLIEQKESKFDFCAFARKKKVTTLKILA